MQELFPSQCPSRFYSVSLLSQFCYSSGKISRNRGSLLKACTFHRLKTRNHDKKPLGKGKLKHNVNRASTNPVRYYQCTYNLSKLHLHLAKYHPINMIEPYLMVFALDLSFLFLSKPQKELSCYMIKHSSSSELENATGCSDISQCNYKRCFFT